MSPLVLPALAFGLSALMLFSLVGLPVSPLTLVIGHTVVCVPYVVRNTVAALGPARADAAGKLSHSRRQPLLHVPPDRVAADPPRRHCRRVHRLHVLVRQRAGLAVPARCGTDMLPIRMWQDLEGKLDVTIAALSGVLIIATVALMAIMERVTGLSKRLTS